MKIVIQTQVRENYAAHTGFNGEYRWKFKGGDTYVVPNLSVKQVLRIKEVGIPTLTALVEQRNDYLEEYILDWSILDDDAVVCEEWETPYELSWEQGHWLARRVVKNDEYGYMHREVAAKSEQYDMRLGGERDNYQCMYTLRDGRVLDNSETNAALAALN
jgi:hypothetical protein